MRITKKIFWGLTALTMHFSSGNANNKIPQKSFLTYSAATVSGSHPPIKIEINDNQYSCYSSVEYDLTDSAFTIDDYSEHGDMSDSLYSPQISLEKVLSKRETKKLYDFMQRFPLEALETEYSSGADKDCDETRLIYIQISIGAKNKDIQIIDCYQKDIAQLFDLINLFLPEDKKEELKIDYDPGRFQCNVQ